MRRPVTLSAYGKDENPASRKVPQLARSTLLSSYTSHSSGSVAADYFLCRFTLHAPPRFVHIQLRLACQLLSARVDTAAATRDRVARVTKPGLLETARVWRWRDRRPSTACGRIVEFEGSSSFYRRTQTGWVLPVYHLGLHASAVSCDCILADALTHWSHGRINNL